MLKYVKPAKSLSSYGSLSAHLAQYLSVPNNALLACGLPEEHVTDVTLHALSARTVLMIVNSVFKDGSCTKDDAIRNVREEIIRTPLMEHASAAHQTVLTASTLPTAKPAHLTKSPTKANATTPVHKAPINKAQHVLTAPAPVRNVAVLTTALSVNPHTFSSKDNVAFNAHPLTIWQSTRMVLAASSADTHVPRARASQSVQLVVTSMRLMASLISA